MGLGKKYSKAQSRILELEAALKQALAIINIQERELKLIRNNQPVIQEPPITEEEPIPELRKTIMGIMQPK